MVSLGFLVAIITLIVSIPVLSKYLVWYFYKPNITIHFETRTCPLYWLELNDIGFGIRNDSEIHYKIEWEIRMSESWDFRNREISKQYNSYTREGLFTYKKKKSGGKDIYLSKHDIIAEPYFPLQPSDEKTYIEIVVYPTVELSEFTYPLTNYNLPGFFPKTQLKPVKKECVVLDDLSEFAMVQCPERTEQLSKTLTKYREGQCR
ncbi:hypothetical protein RBH26_21185 [Natronolimnohabitans sp. A-GB9]|uniref:hypothetical protein n=1 Tax=Natronolimnohabitans sp. A-GB9 TaxID=3069757 RepID=UPI0027B29293|nr:hypothetical protein [Natronolimnohabitans sp. A-GB9]MDQ2052960.1 hypothetical protein [Natronolimnohabitans sp. A-GB9]